MKKRRSRKKNEYGMKKTIDTPRENLHETVEIIEESIEELENPNDDEQIKLESADNYGIEFDEKGMCAKPTPEFWDAWQEDKEEIKGRGWWVVTDRNPFSSLSGKCATLEQCFCNQLRSLTLQHA